MSIVTNGKILRAFDAMDRTEKIELLQILADKANCTVQAAEQLKKKEAHAKVLQTRKKKTDIGIREAVQKWCEKTGAPPNLLLGHRMDHAAANVRRACIVALAEQGFTAASISRELNRDRSTVSSILKRHAEACAQ